jgi:hypothetical protein
MIATQVPDLLERQVRDSADEFSVGGRKSQVHAVELAHAMKYGDRTMFVGDVRAIDGARLEAGIDARGAHATDGQKIPAQIGTPKSLCVKLQKDLT